SYALARLGVPVRLFGKVGRDAPGEFLLRKLRAAGVDTRFIGVSTAPTTRTVCLVQSSGNRSLLHQPGASRDVAPDLIFDSGAASHFHLANPFALPKVRPAAGALLERAKRAGLTTSMDTGWDSQGRWMADVAPCLPHVDLLFVNESELRMLTGMPNPGEAVAELRRQGAADVVVKLGDVGSLVFAGGMEHRTPAFRVPAIDTTGAGDCFTAGFLAAIHRSRSYREAAAFANAVGALSVQSLGSVGGLLGFEETEDWIDQEWMRRVTRQTRVE
ncbi:MAG: carbohydrate kinase family protein, partial [Bryobacteraceae bacterium]